MLIVLCSSCKESTEDEKAMQQMVERLFPEYVNPEKPDVPLNKNDAFQKVQKRRVQKKR